MSICYEKLGGHGFLCSCIWMQSLNIGTHMYKIYWEGNSYRSVISWLHNGGPPATTSASACSVASVLTFPDIALARWNVQFPCVGVACACLSGSKLKLRLSWSSAFGPPLFWCSHFHKLLGPTVFSWC